MKKEEKYGIFLFLMAFIFEKENSENFFFLLSSLFHSLALSESEEFLISEKNENCKNVENQKRKKCGKRFFFYI